MGFILGYLAGGQGGSGLAAIYEYCLAHPGACEPTKGDYFALGIAVGVFAVVIAFLICASIAVFRTSRGGLSGAGGKGASFTVPLPPEFLNRKR